VNDVAARRLVDPAGVEAVTQKYGFIGRSGSGKSYAAMKLAELFLGAGAQIIALDWVGIWWSLRLAANGKAPGFEHVYIFGGEHADVDLRPESGALMADLVVDKHISVVLDVMHFPQGRAHAVRDGVRRAVLPPEEDRAHGVPSVHRRGAGVPAADGPRRGSADGRRLRGHREGRPQLRDRELADQPAAAGDQQGRAESDRSPARVPDQRSAGAEGDRRLDGREHRRRRRDDAGAAEAARRPGARLVAAVVARRRAGHIEKRDTYDASSTPTQQAKAIRPKTLAKADLEQLGEEIQATIEKAKADDPRELRKELARVRQELAQAQKDNGSSQQASTRPGKPLLTDADRAVLEKVGTRLTDLKHVAEIGGAAAFQRAVAALSTMLTNFETDVTERDAADKKAFADLLDAKGFQKILAKLSTHTPEPSTAPRTPPAPRATPSTQIRRPARQTSNGVVLATGERKILTALAQYPEGRSKTQIAILTAYSHNGGGFNNYLSALRTKGFLDGTGDRLRITAAGLDALGAYDPLPTGRDLLEHWLRQLGKAERLILEQLAAAYPDALTKEVLGERTGYEPNGGGFNNALSRLRALELIDGRGTVRASEDLFS
jgi:hypothetical protein